MRHIVLLVLMGVSVQALAQAPTQPATAVALPEGPLELTVTGVEGNVQTRATPDQPWQKVAVDMKLAEGWELRTGPRSAVRFTAGTDQTFTIDRFSTIKILKATFAEGKIQTDLGMKFGRARYDIEGAEREHDTRVRSPSSVLAVRGTRVSLYDQPPFAPQAVSLEGRAQFRDIRKQVTFGGRAKTKLTEKTDTPAKFALQQSTEDARSKFSGRTETDNILALSLQAYGGTGFSDLGVLAFYEQARAGEFLGSVISTLPVGRQLAFNLFWSGSEPFTDVDLSVTSPRGEVVSISSPNAPSSGRFLGGDGFGANGVADDTGGGQESIVWEISYPPGTYTINANLMRGAQDVNATVVVIDDPAEPTAIQAGFIQGTLNPGSTLLTGTVTVPAPPPPPDGAAAQSVKPSRNKATAKPKPAIARQSSAPKPKPKQR